MSAAYQFEPDECNSTRTGYTKLSQRQRILNQLFKAGLDGLPSSEIRRLCEISETSCGSLLHKMLKRGEISRPYPAHYRIMPRASKQLLEEVPPKVQPTVRIVQPQTLQPAPIKLVLELEIHVTVR